MAGRIRSIKPELLEDAKSAKLSDGAWRLFVSGILLADDFGVLRAESRQLQGAVFWGSPDAAGATDRVDLLVAELENAALWTVYTVADQRYAHIRGWDKHQRVDRPNLKARLPTIDEADSLGSGQIATGPDPRPRKIAAGPDPRPRKIATDRESTRTRSRPGVDQDHPAREPRASDAPPPGPEEDPIPEPPDPSPDDGPREPDLPDEAYRLADLVADHVWPPGEGERPKSWVRKRQKWALELDRAHRLDGHSWPAMFEALGWAVADEFWSAQISSAQSLRKHLDKLRLQMRSRGSPRNGKQGMSVQDILAWGDRRAAEEAQEPDEPDEEAGA